jgi:phage/plasmid-like protein (TIGR03299 family)
MAHLVETMAYTGLTPWHGLGNQLPEKQPLEIWAQAAGMDWQIKESPVHFSIDNVHNASMFGSFDEQKVLYRSDTNTALSVVSNRYQVVQPMEVLEFYRDLTEQAGFELETAGVLKGGRKFWALARTGKSTVLKGNDLVNGYVLLATSCDGSLATVAMPTTVRVVCNNTLSIAVNGAEQAVKVSHRSNFDADVVKQRLGIAVSQWDQFMYEMKVLSERKINVKEANRYFETLLSSNPTDATPVIGSKSHLKLLNAQSASVMPNERAYKKLQAMYGGQGRGAELTAAKDTAWGLLCAVTEFVDHERQARSNENRLDSAWFGNGGQMKQKALEQALQLVA